VKLLSDPSESSHLISVQSVCSAKQNLCPKFLFSVISVSLWFAFFFTENGYR
jgi:hypothetical protein